MARMVTIKKNRLAAAAVVNAGVGAVGAAAAVGAAGAVGAAAFTRLEIRNC